QHGVNIGSFQVTGAPDPATHYAEWVAYMDPANYSVNVNWGDGESSPARVTRDPSSTTFVIGPFHPTYGYGHQYDDPGTYAVTYTIDGPAGTEEFTATNDIDNVQVVGFPGPSPYEAGASEGEPYAYLPVHLRHIVGGPSEGPVEVSWKTRDGTAT